MKTLPHNFTTSSSVHNLAAIVGYTKCLADVWDYIISENPTFKEVRSIIINTNNEIKSLEKTEIKTELTSLTKITNPQ